MFVNPEVRFTMASTGASRQNVSENAFGHTVSILFEFRHTRVDKRVDLAAIRFNLPRRLSLSEVVPFDCFLLQKVCYRGSRWLECSFCLATAASFHSRRKGSPRVAFVVVPHTIIGYKHQCLSAV